jgi:hypothetical protein
MMRVIATCLDYGPRDELERQLLRDTVIPCSRPTCMKGDLEISSATSSRAREAFGGKVRLVGSKYRMIT